MKRSAGLFFPLLRETLALGAPVIALALATDPAQGSPFDRFVL